MVGVPTVLWVASVGVDAAEDAVGNGVGNLVLEAVPGQGCVVDLDVDLVLVDEAIPVEEAVDGGAVVVVLMLGRFLGLGLQQQRASEPDRVFVFGDQVQEASELIGLAFHVGVEQCLIALTTTPQHVVLPAQAVRCGQSISNLSCRAGEYFGVGVCCRAGGVARV